MRLDANGKPVRTANNASTKGSDANEKPKGFYVAYSETSLWEELDPNSAEIRTIEEGEQIKILKVEKP